MVDDFDEVTPVSPRPLPRLAMPPPPMFFEQLVAKKIAMLEVSLVRLYFIVALLIVTLLAVAGFKAC